MFPALNPLGIRQTKAREVFLLFRRTEKMNELLNKEKAKKQIGTNQSDVMDVTGMTGGIYDWY